MDNEIVNDSTAIRVKSLNVSGFAQFLITVVVLIACFAFGTNFFHMDQKFTGVSVNTTYTTATTTTFVVSKIYIDQLICVESPKRYHLNQWDTSGFSGAFNIDGTEYSRGIGMYISSSQLATDEIGTAVAVYQIPEGFNAVSFILGAQSNWDYSAKSGTFCVSVYADDISVYNSDWNNYQYSDSIDIGLPADSKLLTIKLEEIEGSAGTLNIVLANLSVSSR